MKPLKNRPFLGVVNLKKHGAKEFMECNLCGCSEFIDMKTRIKATCKNCRSLERTRLLGLYLDNIGILETDRVLHLAPEKGIHNFLLKKVPKNHLITADFDPNLFPSYMNCTKIDLCDLDNQKSNQYDLIIHSHVLEHTPCNIAYTLYHLHRMLTEKGRHVCIIPFLSGSYDEYFGSLDEAERVRRFGQNDHVRKFGSSDIDLHLGKLLNLPSKYNALNDFSEATLIKYNVPEYHWHGFQPGTVLILEKYDMKLLSKPGLLV